jgi:hypothetical protein
MAEQLQKKNEKGEEEIYFPLQEERVVGACQVSGG